MKSINKVDIEICVGKNRKTLCDDLNKCSPYDDKCETQVLESYQNENLICPCMEHCPDGCPCPWYDCGSTTTSTTTTSTTTTTTTTTTTPASSETKE